MELDTLLETWSYVLLLFEVVEEWSGGVVESWQCFFVGLNSRCEADKFGTDNLAGVMVNLPLYS